jgi:serine phosphatase RsbU (regulator of sigma subunit)
MLGSIWSALEAFSDGQDQTDDMTALVLRRSPLAETATDG